MFIPAGPAPPKRKKKAKSSAEAVPTTKFGWNSTNWNDKLSDRPPLPANTAQLMQAVMQTPAGQELAGVLTRHVIMSSSTDMTNPNSTYFWEGAFFVYKTLIEASDILNSNEKTKE